MAAKCLENSIISHLRMVGGMRQVEELDLVTLIRQENMSDSEIWEKEKPSKDSPDRGSKAEMG